MEAAYIMSQELAVCAGKLKPQSDGSLTLRAPADAGQFVHGAAIPNPETGRRAIRQRMGEAY